MKALATRQTKIGNALAHIDQSTASAAAAYKNDVTKLVGENQELLGGLAESTL